MAKDGLIGRDPGVAWLTDTTSIVAATETCLLITQITGDIPQPKMGGSRLPRRPPSP